VARVILPITDPYVVHHGALGSFATIYLPAGVDVDAQCSALAAVRGMEAVLTRAEAASVLSCPLTASATWWCVSERFTVLGTAPRATISLRWMHPLRSHGGMSEQRVPLILNRPACRVWTPTAAGATSTPLTWR
jgi:phosphonoacetate hydrolase